MHLKILKKHFKKNQYGLDYLFNQNKEDYISNNAFKDARQLLNEGKSNLSRKKTNKIRDKLHRKEAVYNFLKEEEQKGGLTNIQKRLLRNIDRYIKNFKNDLAKLQKYQHNIIDGLDYLFNDLMNLMN